MARGNERREQGAGRERLAQVVRRVEQQSQANAEMRRKLARIRENLSIVKS